MIVSTKKYSKILFVSSIAVLLLLSLFLAGCGGSDKECKTKSDCPTKTCQLLRGCEKGQCEYKPQPNCCGNGDKEDEESGKEAGELKGPCVCPKDWGSCKEKGEESDLADFECNDDDECVGELKSGKRVSETATDNLGNFQVYVSIALDNPFIIGYSQLSATYELKEVDSDISEVEIKEAKVFRRTEKRTDEMIGQLDVHQILWNEQTAVSELIPLDFAIAPGDTEQKTSETLTVITTVSYKVTKGTKVDIKSDDITTKIKQNIDVVTPTSLVLENFEEFTCNQKSCDDQNQCTDDICQSVGDFDYCVHNYKTEVACCGNKVCDVDENVCSCPGDCGICERDFGNYLSFTCSASQKCQSQLKDSNLVSKKSFDFDLKEGSYFYLMVSPSFNQPFTVGKDKVAITMTLRGKNDDFINVTILEIKMLEDEELLGQTTGLSTLIKDMDVPYNFQVDVDFEMIKDIPEEKRNPELNILYRYSYLSGDDVKSKTTHESFDFSDIYFINPEWS